MAELPRPDYRSRTRDGVATLFRYFGEVECPLLEAHLYQSLCREIVLDEDLLALASLAPPTQPPPNLLFGAAHYLLLGGEEHELRSFYPALAAGGCGDPALAFPAFRDFCLRHRESIATLVRTRLTQTNVVQRCSVLLPAFARVFEAAGASALGLVEIGPSAGLNLQWHRFHYEYGRSASRDVVTWGDATSPVVVECELRGARGLPLLPDPIPVVWRRGIDLHPIDIEDKDAVQWLRALVWPDHPGRQERLSAAIAIAQRDPPVLLRADAAVALPELLAAVPRDAVRCVYGTHTLYQFEPEALKATLKAMQAASEEAPVWFISFEGTGDRCSELRLTEYRRGGRETVLLARCNAHGRWLEWLV